MRFVIAVILIMSSAHAITRDEGKRLMDGEDMEEVMSKKPKKVVVSECSNSVQCRFDEYCHKERNSDSKGICVAKHRD